MAGWRSGNDSYVQPGVSTGIGDHLWRVCPPGIFQVTQAHSASPSSVGRCNENWQWFRPPLGKTVSSVLPLGPIRRTAGIVAYCTLVVSLMGFNPSRLNDVDAPIQWRRWGGARGHAPHLRLTPFYPPILVPRKIENIGINFLYNYNSHCCQQGPANRFFSFESNLESNRPYIPRKP